jgi:hypothetical protein
MSEKVIAGTFGVVAVVVVLAAALLTAWKMLTPEDPAFYEPPVT